MSRARYAGAIAAVIALLRETSPAGEPMRYTRISADCHLDLPWMPQDLFTANASAALKDRMPYVTDGPDGPYWTCKNGVSFGLQNSVGPAGQKFVPGCTRGWT